MDPKWIEDGKDHLKDIEASGENPLNEYDACSALGHYYLERCLSLPKKVIREKENNETVTVNGTIVSDLL